MLEENYLESNTQKTAHSYHSLGVTQYQLGDYKSALLSLQHALDVRRKLFGEEHAQTANSYQSFGVTQYQLGDYTSPLQSKQHALDVRHEGQGVTKLERPLVHCIKSK